MDSTHGFMSRVGMSTMMFWTEPDPPSLGEMLGLFRRAGMQFVDWGHLSKKDVFYAPHEMDQQVSLVRDSGLRCQQVHGFETKTIHILSRGEALDRYVALQGNRVELCRRLGGDAVVIHPPHFVSTGVFVGGVQLPFQEALEYSTIALDRLRPLCERLGVTLAVENSGTDSHNHERFSFYFARYPSSFVTFCLDVGHANKAGQMEELKAYASRLSVLHLHDNRGEKDDHQPPFFGTVDWAGLFAWLHQIGYTRALNFEVHCDRSFFSGSPADFVADAAARIRRAVGLAPSVSPTMDNGGDLHN